MKHSTESLNALHSVANKCLNELRKVNPDDLETMRTIIDRHYKQVQPLGFIKTELQVEIGYITGSLIDRRNQYE